MMRRPRSCTITAPSLHQHCADVLFVCERCVCMCVCVCVCVRVCTCAFLPSFTHAYKHTHTTHKRRNHFFTTLPHQSSQCFHCQEVDLQTPVKTSSKTAKVSKESSFQPVCLCCALCYLSACLSPSLSLSLLCVVKK